MYTKLYSKITRQKGHLQKIASKRRISNDSARVFLAVGFLVDEINGFPIYFFLRWR